MPIYDYACSACGHRFEAIHGVHDAGPATCPSCGSGPVKKAFAAPAVLFKGSGWAKVDRRSTTRSSTKPSEESAGKGGTSETGTGGAGETAAASGGSDAPSTAATTTTD